MSEFLEQPRVPEEDRREFLKTLGIAGTVSATGITLAEVQDAMGTETKSPPQLAETAEAISTEIGGALDAGLLEHQTDQLASAAATLPQVTDRGFPEQPRNDFGAIAEAGRPIHDHLIDTGFFEVSSEHLPEFHPEFLKTTVETFVGSPHGTEPLEAMDLTHGEGVDLVATVIANAADLEDYNWVASDDISSDTLEDVASVPPITQAAAGGALLWLEDLDDHIWRRKVLLTEPILADAVWYGQSLGAGYYLMSEAARYVADPAEDFDAVSIGAMLATGVAIQEIAQSLLPRDVYWITEDMRDSRRTDLRTVTY